MMNLKETLILVFAMGAVILFCRVFPFLFFRRGETTSPRKKAFPRKAFPRKVFLEFIERTVPPVAMTVLAFNAIGSSFLNETRDGFLVLAASVITALIHLWKRNALISISAGTAVYMILQKVII